MIDADQYFFRIAADHPALPGHFPGQPVVPGVVLLDQVAAAVERSRGRSIARLAQVKFLQPLLPGQEARLQLSTSGERIRFSISHGDREIANGIVEAAA